MLIRLAIFILVSAVIAPAQHAPPIELPPSGTIIQLGGNVYQVGPRTYTFEAPGPPPILVEGIVRQLNPASIVIQTPDYRISWYRFAKKVRIDEDKLHLGDRVAVMYQPDVDDVYIALLVEPLGPGTPEDRAAAYVPWDLPSMEAIEGKPELPVLTRYPPVEIAASEPAPGLPPPPRPPRVTGDPILEKATEASFRYLRDLPNFTVRREVARFNQSFSGRLTGIDVVSANLIYTGGMEYYSNIRLNNQRTLQRLEDLAGLRTTGEFGEIAFALFDETTHTKFTPIGPQEINGRPAHKYEYAVTRENSRWRLFARSEQYYPAYGGIVWIDQETYRVLRVEQQALNLPFKFRYYTAELTIDYNTVRLDEGVRELMPTRTEALSCIRLAPNCQRNSTNFLDYAKFGAASTIVFDEVSP